MVIMIGEICGNETKENVLLLEVRSIAGVKSKSIMINIR